ncbi:MAG TPA: hypothetical protein VK027_09685 [Chitinophagaceae bacterium]|nr:hypothetical protein [Chitinophagaceae bacterium]
MRKLILGSLCLAFLASCTKDYSPMDIDDSRNPLEGTFTYTLDGKEITANAKSVSLTKDEDTGIKTLIVSGVKYSSDMEVVKSNSLTFTISHYDGEKKYTMSEYMMATYTKGDHLDKSADFSLQKNYLSINTVANPNPDEEDFQSYVNIESDGDTFKGDFDLWLVYTNPQDASIKDTIHIEGGKFEIKE